MMGRERERARKREMGERYEGERGEGREREREGKGERGRERREGESGRRGRGRKRERETGINIWLKSIVEGKDRSTGREYKTDNEGYVTGMWTGRKRMRGRIVLNCNNIFTRFTYWTTRHVLSYTSHTRGLPRFSSTTMVSFCHTLPTCVWWGRAFRVCGLCPTRACLLCLTIKECKLSLSQRV